MTLQTLLAALDSFFVRRREALLVLVEEAMGKVPDRDLDRAGGGAESAEAFAEEADDVDDLDDTEATG